MLILPEPFRAPEGPLKSKEGDFFGTFVLPMHPLEQPFVVMLDTCRDWERLSVRHSMRTPRWEELVSIRNLFWMPEDRIEQYMPPADEWVNTHPYALHLWRRVGAWARPGFYPTVERVLGRTQV